MDKNKHPTASNNGSNMKRISTAHTLATQAINYDPKKFGGMIAESHKASQVVGKPMI